MTRGKKITSSLLLGVALVTGGFWASNTYASMDAEKAANEAVHNYLVALDSGDVTTMVELTKDLRFEDDKQKKKV